MEGLVVEKRRELIEIVSEVDDVLLAEKFLNDEPVSSTELEEAIRRATIAQKFVPVFMSNAFKNKGVQPLLDGVISYLPSPIIMLLTSQRKKRGWTSCGAGFQIRGGPFWSANIFESLRRCD